MDWIEAKPSENINNKYLLVCIINLFNIKFPKEYLELIISIVKNSKIYIFEKDINDIEYKCFSGRKNLSKVIIPNSVIYIRGYSFYSCINLTEIIIPDSVIIIEYNAFRNCSNLTKIGIPDSVTNIECGAFFNCVSLISVIIPNSITYIGNYAFWGCENLKEMIILNKSLDLHYLRTNSDTYMGNCIFPQHTKIIRN